MGSDRQALIVNLSGDQKKVLGFASWMQVSITAAGIIIGAILFTLVKWGLTAVGTSSAVAVLTGVVIFALVVAPFAYVAFRPIRDKQGNLLYYMNRQLIIDYQFEKREVGTYVKIHKNRHPVNMGLPYAPIKEDEDDAEE